MGNSRYWLMVLLVALVSVDSGRAEESVAQRRQRIQGMSPARKQELLRRQQQFASLAPAEQDRLRRLHARLQSDADADQLRRVMHRYHQWLETLPAYTRAELLSLEPDRRVKQIKRLRAEQAKTASRRLSAEDLEGLKRWTKEYAARHEAQLLERLPEQRRRQLQQMPAPMRSRMVEGMIWLHLQAGRHKPPLDGRALAKLRSYLSAASRKRLESRPAAGQWKMIAGWIRSVHPRRSGLRFLARPLPADVDEQMAYFFEHELTDQQRDRLLSMPGDAMRRELQKMYWARRGPPARVRRPGGPPPAKRPGIPGHRKDRPEKSAKPKPGRPGDAHKGPRPGHSPAASGSPAEPRNLPRGPFPRHEAAPVPRGTGRDLAD